MSSLTECHWSLNLTDVEQWAVKGQSKDDHNTSFNCILCFVPGTVVLVDDHLTSMTDICRWPGEAAYWARQQWLWCGLAAWPRRSDQHGDQPVLGVSLWPVVRQEQGGWSNQPRTVTPGLKGSVWMYGYSCVVPIQRNLY